MVVHERRRPLSDGVDEDDPGAHLDVVEGQLTVEAPPEVREDLLEAGARRGFSEPPHERRVEVHVGVHEAGEDEPPPGGEDAVERARDLLRGGDPGDPVPLDEESLPLEDPAGAPEGDDRTVPDQEPHRSLLSAGEGPREVT